MFGRCSELCENTYAVVQWTKRAAGGVGPYEESEVYVMGLPQRKRIRLPDYDYSAPGAYFVTICTENRKCILSDITVGALHEAPETSVSLTEVGECVHQVITSLPVRYPNLFVEKYVIMPNHVHLLLRIEEGRALREAPLQENGQRSQLAKIVGYLKMNSSKQIHRLFPAMDIWQRSYHEHVIRNETDYRQIWEYIENNPTKWAEDRYYMP